MAQGVCKSQEASPEETRPELGCPEGVSAKATRLIEQLPWPGHPGPGLSHRAVEGGVTHSPLQPCRADITDLRLQEERKPGLGEAARKVNSDPTLCIPMTFMRLLHESLPSLQPHSV